MTIADRIKKIRKESKKTQEDFGAIIGIGKTSVSKLESGENNPSDQTIMLICKEFSINREWLENGNEPMHIPKNAKISSYVAEIVSGDDDFIKDLIEVYMELDERSKEALRTIADKMVQKRKRE